MAKLSKVFQTDKEKYKKNVKRLYFVRYWSVSNYLYLKSVPASPSLAEEHDFDVSYFPERMVIRDSPLFDEELGEFSIQWYFYEIVCLSFREQHVRRIIKSQY